MQPKVIERTQTGKNVMITGGAEPADKPVREPSSVEQWDHLAQTLIRKELAPKGFSEIKRGPWRGKVQANIPFLPKHTVDRTGKIAAQLVRAYRDKALKALNKDAEASEALYKQNRAKYETCPFWKFGEKKRLYRLANSYCGAMEAYNDAILTLTDIGIK